MFFFGEHHSGQMTSTYQLALLLCWRECEFISILSQLHSPFKISLGSFIELTVHIQLLIDDTCE